MSSGEAELRGMARATCEGLYLKQLGQEFLIELEVVLHGDASAALQNAAKLGPGKIRHLETSQLLIKEAIRKRVVRSRYVKGTENIADVFTKHVDAATLARFISRLGIRARTTQDGEYCMRVMRRVNKLCDLKAVPARRPFKVAGFDRVRHIEHVDNDGPNNIVGGGV